MIDLRLFRYTRSTAWILFAENRQDQLFIRSNKRILNVTLSYERILKMVSIVLFFMGRMSFMELVKSQRSRLRSKNKRRTCQNFGMKWSPHNLGRYSNESSWCVLFSYQ